jgi:hypothetical protein
MCRTHSFVGQFCVRFVKPLPLKGFSSIWTQMFTLTRGCVDTMPPLCQLKVKSYLMVKCQTILCFKSYISWRGFSSTDPDVQQPMLQLCWLGVKVTLESQMSDTFISINPLPLEGFSSNLVQTTLHKCTLRGYLCDKVSRWKVKDTLVCSEYLFMFYAYFACYSWTDFESLSINICDRIRSLILSFKEFEIPELLTFVLQ